MAVIAAAGARWRPASPSITELRTATYGPYAATTAALQIYSSILAKELAGRMVSVNALAPGVNTPLFTTGMTDEQRGGGRELDPATSLRSSKRWSDTLRSDAPGVLRNRRVAPSPIGWCFIWMSAFPKPSPEADSRLQAPTLPFRLAPHSGRSAVYDGFPKADGPPSKQQGLEWGDGWLPCREPAASGSLAPEALVALSAS